MSPTTNPDRIFRRQLRYLAGQSMSTISDPDFLLGGLGQRVSDLTVRMLAVPSDPDADVVEFDQGFWDRFDAAASLRVDDWPYALGTQQIPTAHAAARVDSPGTGHPWREYCAVHRNGSIEIGLGTRGARDISRRDENTVRIFFLTPIVVAAWALAATLRAMIPDPTSRAPWVIGIGCRNTAGALLGGLGEGWVEPLQEDFHPPQCGDQHLLWHLQLDRVPQSDDDDRDVAFKVGNRFEDAWGVRERRYLAYRGSREGHLDPRYFQ